MRAEKVVSHLLNNDAAITAIVDEKIYGGVSDKGAKAPLLVYALQGSTAEPDLSAAQSVVTALVDVLIVARTYPELKELSELVRVAVSYKYPADVVPTGVELLETQPNDVGPDEYASDIDEHSQVRTFVVVFVEQ